MIKTVTGIGRHLVVYNTGASTYTNNYSGAQGIGNMRFNTTVQKMEVWDGTMWQIINMGDVTVSFSAEAQDALEWAIQQREQQRRWNSLAEQSPAVADQLAEVRAAEEKLRMIAALVEV